MPTRRCCCTQTNPCPEFCYEFGNKYNCLIETAEFYGAQIASDSVRLGTGPDLCCQTFWDSLSSAFMKPVGGCLWQFTGSGCASSMTLQVVDEDHATLTIILADGSILVYSANPGYDPLCNSVFTYTSVGSTPPTTCQWHSRLCVSGKNTCCPDMGYPERIYVSWFEVDGNCACIDDDNTHWLDLVYVNPTWELFHNEVRARWFKASIPIGTCGVALNMTLECRFTVPNGYTFAYKWDQPANPADCAGLDWTEGHIIDGGTENGPGDPDISCLPFSITNEGIVIAAANCCFESENNGIMFTL